MTNNFIGRNIYLELLELIRINETCVLATVTKTVGSTPQKPGCSAVFGKKHLLAGTVGGGVVELKIKEKSINAMNTQKSGYY